MYPPISPASIGGIRQFVLQIPSMYLILMGYWMLVQAIITMSSVIYKSKLIIGEISLEGSSWCHARCYWEPTWLIPGSFLSLSVVGVGVESLALGMHFYNYGSLRAPVLGLLIYLGIYVELGQEIFDITLVLGWHKAILGVLSEVQIIVSVFLAWWISDSFTYWWGTGPLPMIFYHVVDPLAFARAVLLAPPILLFILGFVSHSIFWLFQHTGW